MTHVLLPHMHMETEKIGPNLALDLFWNHFVAFKPETFGPGPMVSPVTKKYFEIPLGNDSSNSQCTKSGNDPTNFTPNGKIDFHFGGSLGESPPQYSVFFQSVNKNIFIIGVLLIF